MNEVELIKYEKLASLNNEDAIFMLANHYQEDGGEGCERTAPGGL